MNNGDFVFCAPMTPQILAMQWAPPRKDWLWLEGEQEIAAWRGFVTTQVTNCAVLTEERGGKRGLLAPWRWPPNKDGAFHDDD